MTPLERYNSALKAGELTADNDQHQVVLALEKIYQDILSTRLPPAASRKSGFFHHLRTMALGKQAVPRVSGLYLWGGVGRGKTHLTDMFFSCMPIDNKKRLHFHSFMQLIHDELRLVKGEEDPLLLVADKWIDSARLLVLDEMHVNDITDAMLLGKLLGALFERGLTLVTTSNVHPDDLYREGLQRARFLPAIEQIKQHTLVHSMEGETDYRLRVLKNANIYFDRADPSAVGAMRGHFDKLCTDKDSVSEQPLIVNRRELPVVRSGAGVVWFDFDTLCNTPRSTHDYIEIATLFHSVVISDIPVLNDNRNDAARRLVNLVDEFYDRNVNLIISAEAEPEKLYTGTRLAFEFVRAASRLREMQTVEYLSRHHLGELLEE